MSYPLDARMNEILALTKQGRLEDATALIQRRLGSARFPDGASGARPAPSHDVRALPRPALSGPQRNERVEPLDSAPKGMRRHRFATASGRLDYLLYLPARVDTALPLVVMLHGCTQSAEDFARGTRMNELAEELGFVVAYPEQTQSANMQKCWNWFRPGDQIAGAGEPAMIAGITREIMVNHPVDPARVYVAGLSAGGAAAAIMADAYPELYAAVGIHSGLACGSARDLPSALAAMKGKGAGRSGRAKTYVPLITFHGDRDNTVHPENSRQILAAWASAPQLASLERKVDEGVNSAGRRYRRTSMMDPEGRSLAESWEVAGAGHAWSGGSSTGSYTDAKGPDASREMVRFFFQHRRA